MIRPTRGAFLALLLSASGVSLLASCAESGHPAAPLPDAGEPPSPEASAPVVEQCQKGAWCRVELPEARVSLNGIWGSGPSDVWIVGTPAIVHHWNGSRFESSRIETNQSLFGIWGSGKDDVWAFSTTHSMWHAVPDAGWSRSNGTVGMLDGGGYPPAISAMWGPNATDLWAVGPSTEFGVRLLPSVYHSEGWRNGEPDWQPSHTGDPSASGAPALEKITFNAVCGSSDTRVWIAGNGGKMRYSSGWRGEATTWSPLNSHTSRDLFALWCSPDGDVWTAGEGGVIRRITRSEDGYVASEIETPTTRSLRGLWGAAADDIWAVGDAGTILHWDGKAWSVPEAPLGATQDNLFAIWGASKDELWIAGRNVLLHNGSAPIRGKSL